MQRAGVGLQKLSPSFRRSIDMNPFIARHSQRIYSVLNWLMLLLSAGLITYLSVDALRGVEFLTDSGYMHFQLLVCMVFIADFFIELYMSHRRWHYVGRRIAFLLLSIPYLNILNYLGITLSPDALYFARFLPLGRGALAMAIVVGYISKNRLTNIFASYSVILIAIVYFGSLIFYEREMGVNPDLKNYMQALWWACSDATTTGCTIFPVTPAGKIVSAVLAVMGMVMFPLFTVVITSAVRQRISSTPSQP